MALPVRSPGKGRAGLGCPGEPPSARLWRVYTGFRRCLFSVHTEEQEAGKIFAKAFKTLFLVHGRLQNRPAQPVFQAWRQRGPASSQHSTNSLSVGRHSAPNLQKAFGRGTSLAGRNLHETHRLTCAPQGGQTTRGLMGPFLGPLGASSCAETRASSHSGAARPPEPGRGAPAACNHESCRFLLSAGSSSCNKLTGPAIAMQSHTAIQRSNMLVPSRPRGAVRNATREAIDSTTCCQTTGGGRPTGNLKPSNSRRPRTPGMHQYIISAPASYKWLFLTEGGSLRGSAPSKRI